MFEININSEGVYDLNKSELLDYVAEISVNYYENRIPLNASLPIEFGRFLSFCIENCLVGSIDNQVLFLDTDVDYKPKHPSRPYTPLFTTTVEKDYFDSLKNGSASYISSSSFSTNSLSKGHIVQIKCNEYKSVYPKGIFRKISYVHPYGFSLSKLTKSEFDYISNY